MADNNQNPGTQQQEPGAQQQPGTQQQSPGANIDFDKLGEAIARGITQKERSVANGFLKEAGLTEEEAKKAFEAYKSQKTKQAEEEAARQSNLQKENEQLKAQILQGKVDATLNKVANELGVKAESISYLSKLADLSKITNDKGEVDEGLVKQSVETVLKDFPMLKGTDEANSGFVPFGGSSNGSGGGNPAGNNGKAPAQKPWNRINHY